MYRVCVGYVSRMYRVYIGIFGKVTTFFSYMQIFSGKNVRNLINICLMRNLLQKKCVSLN